MDIHVVVPSPLPLAGEGEFFIYPRTERNHLMGYISKLDAVNMMMLSAGESLVADLQEASGIDTGIASFLLDQFSIEHQSRGNAENKIVKKLNADANGHLLIGYPNNDYAGILEASLKSDHYNDDNILIKARVTETNPPRLYNMTDETDVWDADTDYYVSIVALLKWEHLDTPTQRAILASAMRRYQLLLQGDRQTDQILAQDEMLAKIKAKADSISDKKLNLLDNTPAANRFPYSRRNNNG
jgi:hypothetical protein